MSRIEEVASAYDHCHGSWKCRCTGCPYSEDKDKCNNLEDYVMSILKSLAIVQGTDPKFFEEEIEDGPY